MTKFALEKYPIFPYVAWAIVIGFSVFVFYLAQNLFQATSDLRDSTNQLEAQVHMPVESIDFNHSTTTKHSTK